MRNKVILLVEDNPDDEILTLRAMKKNNVINKVIIAHDGVEALDYLYKRGNYADRDDNDIPQLILMDVNMPKMNGLEALREIRSNPKTKLLPVVMLTSSREEQDMIESYELGANSYIKKPVDFDQFVEAVKQLGVYWMVLNELPGTI